MRPRTKRHGGNPAAPRPRPAPAGGLTLVELLVVISIIVLLVTILTPAFHAALNSARSARCKARIVELADGCEAYAQDNGKLYPGQLYPEMLTGSSPAGPYTGTQVLAACMFGYDYPDINNPNRAVQGRYAALGSEDLRNISGRQGSIWDRFPRGRPQAICYYPARLSLSGTGQYKEGDNSAYTAGSVQWTGGNFSVYVRDNRFDANASAGPFHPGRFILLAPGPDGKYGTSDDVSNMDK